MNEIDGVQRYLNMQKSYYNVRDDDDGHMDLMVGAYGHHEQYPYEQFLLEFFPEPTEDKLALDFGCGPGRMIRRMSKLFKRVDGVDISPGMIAGARRRTADLPNPPCLWVIDGQSLRGIPDETYDFVYCTISYHHIASYEVRMRLLAEFSRVLKVGGRICLHLMYTTHPRHEWMHHVNWRESMNDADGTNGYHDVRITPENLPDLIQDFKNMGLEDFNYTLAGMPFPHETTTNFMFASAQKKK